MPGKSSTGKNKAGRTAQDIVNLSRVLVSVLLLIIAYKVKMSGATATVVLAIAALISGFDIITAAMDRAITKRDYLSNQLMIAVSAIACFCVGCYSEAVIMLVVYQIGRTALGFTIRKTKAGFFEANAGAGKESRLLLRSILSSPSAQDNAVMRAFMPYFDLLGKAAFAVGVLFAIFIPMLTDMSYVMSIRRGSMLIAAAVPLSALAALPVYTLAGISNSAEYGVYIKNADALEKTGKLGEIIYDKADVLTEGAPKLVSVNSPMLGNEGFLCLAAHCAYGSEQRFAAPIVSAYSGDILTSYIRRFKDIPGCGMEISLSGHSVLLGTRELFEARSIEIPETDKRGGYVLYLALGGRYAGSMTFKESINPYAESVISDFREMGNVRSILLTEDGREISERLAGQLKVDELHYECSFGEKADIIEDCKAQLPPNELLMYISAENLSRHSAADIDAKVGESFDNANIIMDNIGIFGLPVAYSASNRVRRLSVENLVFTAIVKLILIILAFTGGATLWFIVLLDFAVSILGVLNAVRLPQFPKEEIDEE